MGNIKGIICVKVNNKTIYSNDEYKNDIHLTDKNIHKSSVNTKTINRKVNRGDFS